VEILKKIFNKNELSQKEDKSEINNNNNKKYTTAVVDFPNVCQYDIGSALRILKHYTEGDIIFVTSFTTNKYVDLKLRKIVPMLSKYSVLVAMSDTVDTDVIKHTMSRIKRGDKVLLMTSDIGIMSAIVAQASPDDIGFLVSPEVSHDLPFESYEVIAKEIITSEEGIIRRILQTDDFVIKRARGYIITDSLRDRVLSYLPSNLSNLYDQLYTNGIVKDKNQFLHVIASMVLRKIILLKGAESPDKVMVEKGE